jgi:hypothetical protein
MLDRIFSQHPTIHKYDRLWIGAILGLIVPNFGILMVYLLSVANHIMVGSAIISIHTLISNIKSLEILSKFLSVGCMLNLGMFFLFINRDYFNLSRGIIFATMLFSLPIIYISIHSWFV